MTAAAMDEQIAGSMLADSIRNAPAVQRVLTAVVKAENFWFDTTRGVRTAASHTLKGLALDGNINDAMMYNAIRTASARAAIRALPISRHQEYLFVDFGSGRGKVLFIAAEYPFHQVIGVEFARELHDNAVRNIADSHGWWRRCERIESVHKNAMDFEFPTGNQVLFFFNPFAPEVAKRVLTRLGASLETRPRDVLLVLVYPEQLAPVFESIGWLEQIGSNRRFNIYRALSRRLG